MGIEGGLPLFRFEVDLVLFDQFYDFEEMRGNGVIKRGIVRAKFNVGVPALESSSLIVVREI